jgi:hypothetical protein
MEGVDPVRCNSVPEAPLVIAETEKESFGVELSVTAVDRETSIEGPVATAAS